MPTIISLDRTQRSATEKEDATAASFRLLREKREHQKLKEKQRLKQLRLQGSDDELADSDFSDDDQSGTAHLARTKERRRLQPKVKSQTPSAESGGLDDVINQFSSLKIPKKQTPSPARPSSKPSISQDSPHSYVTADSPVSVGSADSDGEFNSDSSASDHQQSPGNLQAEGMILDNGEFKLHGKISNRLYPHQIGGVEWLLSLHKLQRGGILGDDMGLGKTLQCAAFITGMFQSKRIKRVLVVAPLTLLAQWQKEFEVCGISHLVHEYYGNATNSREAALRSVMRERGIVLTTYGMVLHNAAELARSPTSRNDDEDFQWDFMFLDEGHKVKNPSTKQYQALKTLPVAVRVIVSGTPIQNNLMEMHALFDLCTEDLLGTKSMFRNSFEKPITQGQNKDATERQRQLGAAKAKELRKTIGPFFLRREKKDTLVSRDAAGSSDGKVDGDGSTAGGSKASTQAKPAGMPHKNDMVVWLPLKPLQARVYMAFLSSSAVKRALSQTDSPLAAITVLKKIADHPALISKRATQSVVHGASKWAAGEVGSDSEEEDSDSSDSGYDSMDDFIVDDDSSDDETAKRKKGKKGSKAKCVKQKKVAKKPADEEDVEALDTLAAELWGEGGNLEETLMQDLEQRGVEASCKTAFVLELLRELKGKGHKTLVFSQSRVMLNILQAAIVAEGMKICRIDGSVSDRQAVVDKFQSDPSIPVFLLTSQVGGLGLTITAADRVIIIDPAWNPAVDNQSVDRAYRIGQTKDVVVYRLITCGTVEEKIYKRQVFKGGLSRTGTEEGVQFRYFNHNDLRDLFTITPEGLKQSATQQELQELHSHNRKTTPELDAHLEKIQSMAGCAGISDHDLLFTTKAAEEQPLSPNTAAAMLKGPAHAAFSSRNPPGAGFPATAADELIAKMAAGMNLGGTSREAAPRDGEGLADIDHKIKSLQATIKSTSGLKLADGGEKLRQHLLQLQSERDTKVKQFNVFGTESSDGLFSSIPSQPQAPGGNATHSNPGSSAFSTFSVPPSGAGPSSSSLSAIQAAASVFATARQNVNQHTGSIPAIPGIPSYGPGLSFPQGAPAFPAASSSHTAEPGRGAAAAAVQQPAQAFATGTGTQPQRQQEQAPKVRRWGRPTGMMGGNGEPQLIPLGKAAAGQGASPDAKLKDITNNKKGSSSTADAPPNASGVSKSVSSTQNPLGTLHSGLNSKAAATSSSPAFKSPSSRTKAAASTRDTASAVDAIDLTLDD